MASFSCEGEEKHCPSLSGVYDKKTSYSSRVQDGNVCNRNILASFLESGRKWRCILHL